MGISSQTVPTSQQTVVLTKVELDPEEMVDSQQEVGTTVEITMAREESLLGD